MSNLISVHATWLRAAGRANNTIDDRVQLLRRADRQLPTGLDDAHTDELAAWLANPDWSQWTRHTYFTHLHGFYSWAVWSGHYRLDPTAWLARPPQGPRLPHPVTTEQLLRLLTAPPPWPLVLILAGYAGMRTSEIAVLDRDDVTIDHIRIHGKGGRLRMVDTHPLVWDLVAELPPGRVVRDRRTGSPLTGRQLTSRAGSLFRRRGISKGRLHRVRAWFATSALLAGADVETVRQLLGHASLDTTRHYLEIVAPRRREAVHRLPVIGHQAAFNRLVPGATGRAA